MQTIQALPRRLPEYQKLLRELQTGGVVSVYGTAPVHCAHITAALRCLCGELPSPAGLGSPV